MQLLCPCAESIRGTCWRLHLHRAGFANSRRAEPQAEHDRHVKLLSRLLDRLCVRRVAVAQPVQVPVPPDRPAHAVRVDFSDAAWTTILELAEYKRCTPAEVLRDAIGLYKWMDDRRLAGWKILIERDGWVNEVLIP